MGKTLYCSFHRGRNESIGSFMAVVWQMMDVIEKITGKNVSAKLESDDEQRNMDYATFYLKGDEGEITQNQSSSAQI